MLRLLKATRRSLGETQEELAGKLGESQSFVSKCERGERRLDIIELRAFCSALVWPLPKFLRGLEKELSDQR